MLCPADGTTLVMTERSGVEIDYCPKCRGVWLDRGELDKILDRAAAEMPRPRAPEPAAPPRSGPFRPEPAPQEYRREEPRRTWRDDDDDDRREPRPRRRESFLSDLLDF